MRSKRGWQRAVPPLPQFHFGNCDHANIRYDFKREGKHLIYNTPGDDIPADILADIATAGFRPRAFDERN